MAWAAGKGWSLAAGCHCGRSGVGKVYQWCRPAPVARVNLCVADNPNAAIVTARGEKCVWVDRLSSGYNRHNRYSFTPRTLRGFPRENNGLARSSEREIRRRQKVGSQAHQEIQENAYTRQGAVRRAADDPKAASGGRAKLERRCRIGRGRSRRTTITLTRRRRSNGAATRARRAAGPPPSRWRPSSATSRSASSSPRTATCWASTIRARRCSPRSRKRSTTRSTPAKRPASCRRFGSTSKRPAPTASRSACRTTAPASSKSRSR